MKVGVHGGAGQLSSAGNYFDLVLYFTPYLFDDYQYLSEAQPALSFVFLSQD
jgi:hypothetical protein